MYIRAETAMLPNAVVINLNHEAATSNTGSDGHVTITFPAADGKFGYMSAIDGG